MARKKSEFQGKAETIKRKGRYTLTYTYTHTNLTNTPTEVKRGDRDWLIDKERL